MDDTDITTELTASVRQVLDVYDAALDVCAAVLDLAAPRPAALVVATRELMRALAVAGVLDRESTLDPAAVLRLSPPIPPGPAAVTMTPADRDGS